MKIPGAKDWILMTDGKRFAAQTPFGALLKLRSRKKEKAISEAQDLFKELGELERKARRERDKWRPA